MLTFIRSLIPSWIRQAAPAGGGDTVTVEDILRAEEARYAAQMSNDFAAMERMFSDDLVYYHSSTVVDTKASFIESMRSGTVRYRKMTRGEVTTRVFGSVGIITGKGSFEVTARGQDMVLNLMFTVVWAKRVGTLQFVSWQATRLPG
ncbi:MAG: nuclear transport factor 2 family protein [Betaproteobacteria bacterium]|nr:nuclear transport factor 2 family protein [Betaproteobacteria bacterium]